MSHQQPTGAAVSSLSHNATAFATDVLRTSLPGGRNSSMDKDETFHASSSGEHNLVTNSEGVWGGGVASREHYSAQQCSCKSALYVWRDVQTF